MLINGKLYNSSIFFEIINKLNINKYKIFFITDSLFSRLIYWIFFILINQILMIIPFVFIGIMEILKLKKLFIVLSKFIDFYSRSSSPPTEACSSS
jgi:hypothetical protein